MAFGALISAAVTLPTTVAALLGAAVGSAGCAGNYGQHCTKPTTIPSPGCPTGRTR